MLTSRRLRLGVLWGALALPGCLVTPPPVLVRAQMGLVRADSPSAAENVALLIDQLAPQVHALLPDTRGAPLEVWVQRELGIYRHWDVDPGVPAFTIEGLCRIHLQESGPRELSAALGHELVHALLGESWETLPAVVEEGLADWVQERLHPDLAASLRADHLAKASAAFGGLDLGVWLPGPADGEPFLRFTFLAPPPGSAALGPPSEVLARRGGEGGAFWAPYQVSVSDPRLYGMGYLVAARIVERHGMAALHELCLRAGREGLAQVPSAWLLERADLDDDPRRWHAAVAARFGPMELAALGRTLVPFLVDLLTGDLRQSVSARSGDEFLRRYRPRLGLLESAARVPLTSVPDFRGALRRAWPRETLVAQ